MALVVHWRYSWMCLFFFILLGLNSGLTQSLSWGLTESSDYYGYEVHSIHRRSASANDGGSDAQPKQPQISTKFYNISSTSTTTTTEAPHVEVTQLTDKSNGNTNSTSNSTTNSEDANRTSHNPTNSTTNATSLATPNGSPLMQQEKNTTVVSNTTVPVSNSTGNNSTVVVPEGISAEGNSSTTEINDYTTNEFDSILNETSLRDLNITKTLMDHHQYYNSSFIIDNETIGHQYWVDMNRSDVTMNEMLSQSHRRAVTVKLSFDFPFYGHIVRNVTVATGGFLYTGEYVHSWLAATQYIAPLMANFDTSISKDSYVKYVDNGTSFTVQWEKVVLQDKPNSGDFTFQATLHKNGDIVFVYRSVPVVIKSIQDDKHPVKVGLSDAYIIDRTIFFVRRKTIYEYHRVNFDRQDIKNWTVIVLNALPTCVDHKDCESCVTMNTGFRCLWCTTANRCSTGTDRNRQDWLHRNCDSNSYEHSSQCPAVATNSTYDIHNSNGIPNHSVEGETNSAAQTDHSEKNIDKHMSTIGDRNVTMGISGIIGILFIVALVASLGIWALYAYRNPHTASGQFLIRYRPSQWSWKRGEARYTAATIHM